MTSTRRNFLYAMPAAGLWLAGCSKTEEKAAASSSAAPAAASQAPRAPTVEIVAAEAKGFTVGSMMSNRPVYVFFDPQCPHCGHLWEASIPLQKRVKFVWIPVAFINASSAPQGATIMSAADPAATMAEHEQSLLAKKGGISAASSLPDGLLDTIKKNTGLLNNFQVASVPFVIAQNARTGATVTNAGAMSTEALAQLIGIDSTP